jgi:hypothetical protein
MGFALSIVYLAITYLSPPAILGPLAQYRVEMILAVLILVVSLPKLIRSSVLKAPQTLALIGMSVAVFFSVLFGMHWLNGAFQAWAGFLPSVYAYFIVILHCNTRRRLKIMAVMLLVVCMFVLAHGAVDLLYGVPDGGPPLSQDTGTVDLVRWNADHPYLFAMASDEGNWFYRIRGLGTLNDPNDLGQLVVTVIPLMFFFWKPKKAGNNLLFVLLPVAMLLLMVFLTHSRGALMALTVMAVLAGRRSIGLIPATVLASIVFVGAIALQFTGGRAISASAGEDRTSLWGEGLSVLKSHPVFGIGLNQLPDYTDNHLTAHNSIIVCAAELGMFGLYFWSLFLLPTMRDVVVIATPERVTQGEPIVPETPMLPGPLKEYETLEPEEINRLARLLLLSSVGFLVTSWFLSTAIAVTLFLVGGMVEVVYQMALERGMTIPRMRYLRVLIYSGGLAVVFVVVMYLLVRALNLAH